MPDATDIAGAVAGASPVGAAIQGGLGAISAITNLVKGNQLEKKADELKRTRPKYSITPESSDELSLAESELSNGGTASTAAYNNLASGDYANSVDAILKSGGGANNIGDVYGAAENGREKLKLMQDDLRMKNLNNLILARRNMSEQRDKQFQFNQWMPWADKAQAVGLERENADKGAWEGLSTIAQAGMGYSQGKYEANMWDKYLNPPQKTAAENPLWQITPQQPTVTNDGTQTVFTPTSNNTGNDLLWSNAPNL